MSVRVALAGCGVWGRNLLRVLAESPRAEVVAVADPSRAAQEATRGRVPRARRVPSLDDALASDVDAVVIATPAATHAALAMRALEAGADVLVEKPLAMTAADAERCAARAAALGRVGMVGHLMRYHPAVVELLDRARRLELGPVRHLAAARLSAAPGGDRALSTLWTLGPHDLSVLLALDASPLVAIEARATPGGVSVEARLDGGVTAVIELSQSSPTKERRLRVVGASGYGLFDDVRSPATILLGRAGGALEEVRVPWREPLAIEVDHFLECVEARTQPRTPFDEGVRVVRALERADARAAAASPRIEA